MSFYQKFSKNCPPKPDDPDGPYCNEYLLTEDSTPPLSRLKRRKKSHRTGNDPLFLSESDGLFVEMDDSSPLSSLVIKQEKCDEKPQFIQNSVTSGSYRNIPTNTTSNSTTIANTSTPSSSSNFTKKDKDQLDNAVAKFVYGCNIPFSVIESNHFKSLLRQLRPTYYSPSVDDLATTLLDRIYADVGHPSIVNDNKIIPNETILLIEMKTLSNIVTMLQTNDGKYLYLESYNYSNLSGKIGKALAQASTKAIELTNERYNVNVFAIVSAYSNEIAQNWPSCEYWLNICHHTIAKELAKELIDTRTLNNVTKVLNEFKSMEKLIMENGGNQIILVTDTSSMLTAFESMNCFLTNLTYMRDISNETNDISDDITTIIYNEAFVCNVRDNVRRLDSIMELIKKSQTLNYSIADATEQWLDLIIDETLLTEHMQQILRAKINESIIVYGLTANFLHPIYRGTKLNSIQMDMVDDFLLNALDVNGLNSLMEFKNNCGMFKNLLDKGVQSPTTFWGLLERKHMDLSRLAIKLLKIPASLVVSDRVDSIRSFVHINEWNRLNLEQNSKLLHCYYSLKLLDTRTSDQY